MGGLVWGILCLSFDLHIASFIPFGYVVLTFLNGILWKKTEKFHVVSFLQVFLSILLPFLFQSLLGGYEATGMVMLWALLALIGLLTFSSTRRAAWWSVWFIALLVISLSWETTFSQKIPEALTSDEVQRTLLGVNLSMVSVMLFFLASYFLWLQRKATQELETSNTNLARSEREKEVAYREVLASEEELRQNMEELNQLNENLVGVTRELGDSIQREAQAKAELEASKNHEIAQRNAQIMSSIRYAKRIQKSVLPTEEDLQKFLPESFILFRPRDIVSGDFWWFRPIYRNKTLQKLILVVADCTGHGVPGAFMSLIGYNLLNSIVIEERMTESDKILNRLRDRIRESLRQDDGDNVDGMDLGLVVLNFETQMLSFSGAMNPLIAVQNETLMILDGDKMPIGGTSRKTEDRKYEQHLLYWGSEPISFYLFSDGFQDQFGGPKTRKFMKRRLRELLCSIHTVPIEEQKSIVARVFDDWKKGEKQVDDVLLLGGKIG